MPPEDLRKGRAMERFQDRAIIVKLCKGGIQRNKKPIVHAWMSHIVPNGRDK